MGFKKFVFCFLVILVLSTASFGVVFSVVPPTIYASDNGSGGITVVGSSWTYNVQIKIYWDVQAADHLLATPTADWTGSFTVTIPSSSAVSLGTHMIIAVQGAKTATTPYNVNAVTPPDDRTLNQISQGNTGIQSQLTDIQSQLSFGFSNLNTKIDSIKSLQILFFNSSEYAFHVNDEAKFSRISASQAVIFIVTIKTSGLTGDNHVHVDGLDDQKTYKDYSGDDILQDTLIFPSHFMVIARYDAESNVVTVDWSIMVLGTPGTTLSIT